MQITGALCAGDFKSLSDQQAGNGKFVATVIKGAAIGRKPENGPQRGEVLEDGTCYTLNCTEQHAVAFTQNSAVRRLTPRECERLQGFSDNFTRIPYRGKPASQCPDGPRYKALGNSMAVPVMRWIGEQIQRHEELKV